MGSKVNAVKVIETKKASPDGIQVLEFKAGQVYNVGSGVDEIPEHLANLFVSNKWGEATTPSKKSLAGPSENKSGAGGETTSLDLDSMTVEAIKEAVASMDNIKELEDLYEKEGKGKKRQGALDAIDARLIQIEENEENG